MPRGSRLAISSGFVPLSADDSHGISSTLMKKRTVSQAKNLMRRVLNDLLDPPPSEAHQLALREHFAHRCCYCGASAPPRDGHIDHADRTGGNGLGNLLLACKLCNGDEKRDQGWEDFLRSKNSDATVLAERFSRISAWRDGHPGVHRELSPHVELARREVEATIDAFAEACARLRDALPDHAEPAR